MEACWCSNTVKLPVHGLPLHPVEEDTIRPVPNWMIRLTSSGDPDMLLADAVMRVLSPSSTCPWLDWSVTSNVSVSSPELVHTDCSPDRSLGAGVGVYGAKVGGSNLISGDIGGANGALTGVETRTVGVEGVSHAASVSTINKQDTASFLGHIGLNTLNQLSDRTIGSLMIRIIR